MMESATKTLENGVDINVGVSERGASVLFGLALLNFGFRHLKSVKGFLALGAGSGLIYVGATGHSTLYQAIGLSNALTRRGKPGRLSASKPIRMTKIMTIDRPVREVYSACFNLENISHFGTFVSSVNRTSPGHAHWIFRGPINAELACNIELTEERANERLSWRSLPGSKIDTRGALKLREVNDGRSTELSIEVDLAFPGGLIEAALNQAIRPFFKMQLNGALRRLKRDLEGVASAAVPGQALSHLRRGRRLAVGNAPAALGTQVELSSDQSASTEEGEEKKLPEEVLERQRELRDRGHEAGSNASDVREPSLH